MITLSTTSAEDTQELGERVARLLRAGDMVMLSGGLGAGKTTITQGLGRGLNVEGRVSSPTFTISRVHPNRGDGPDLVHVDAYRVQSVEEIDALDLDTSLEDCVTVVEWGQGKVEGLSENRLEILISRPHGGLAMTSGEGGIILDDADDGHRSITITGYGPRWDGVDLQAELG